MTIASADATVFSQFMCGHFNVFDESDNQIATVNYLGDLIGSDNEAVFDDADEALSKTQLQYLGNLIVERKYRDLVQMYHGQNDCATLRLTAAETIHFLSMSPLMR